MLNTNTIHSLNGSPVLIRIYLNPFSSTHDLFTNGLVVLSLRVVLDFATPIQGFRVQGLGCRVGLRFLDPFIHLSPFRIDYILHSHAHAFIYKMFAPAHMFSPYVYAFYLSSLRLIVHVHMFLKFVKCQIHKLSICKHITLHAPLLSLCVFLYDKNAQKGKTLIELVILCFGMRLVVFKLRMQFTFLAIAMQSHAQLYSLMSFSNKNFSHAYAFHMSSHRTDFMWSHACISTYSFVITQARSFSMLTCSCTSHTPCIRISYVLTCPYVYAFYMSALWLIVHSLLVPLLSANLDILTCVSDSLLWHAYIFISLSIANFYQFFLFLGLLYSGLCNMIGAPKRVGYDLMEEIYDLKTLCLSPF